MTIFLLGCSGDVNHFDVSKKSDAEDHYVIMGNKLTAEAIKTAECAKLKETKISAQLEYITIPRIEVAQ